LSLLDVVEHIEQLPDDDPRLARIDSAYRVSELGFLSLGFSGEYVIRTWNLHRNGYGGPPHRFLDDFAEAAERDAAASAEEEAMAAEDEDDD
jgi:hypothetical protein